MYILVSYMYILYRFNTGERYCELWYVLMHMYVSLLYLPILLFLLCLCIVHIIHLSMYNLLAAPQEPLFGIRIVLREIIVTKNRHPCIVRNAFSQILGQGGVNTLRNYVHMYTPSLTGLV